MSLDCFVAETEATAQMNASKIDIVTNTKNAIKIKLNISELIAVPCYYNQT